MKEDYLWNKTGNDPEIERLENALKAFRYEEAAPPALPSKIIPFERKTSRGFFRLVLAFGSFAAIVIAGLGVWLNSSDKQIEAAKTVNVITPPVNEVSANENSPAKQINLINEQVKKPKPSVERKVIKISKIVPPIIRQQNLTARNIVIKKPGEPIDRNVAVKLTKEEKYAYNQLMLALSITGSKLKLVADKIDGVEEQHAVRGSRQ